MSARSKSPIPPATRTARSCGRGFACRACCVASTSKPKPSPPGSKPIPEIGWLCRPVRQNRPNLAWLLLAQQVDGHLRRRTLDRAGLGANLADAVPGHRARGEEAIERRVGDVTEAVLQPELVTQRLLPHA